MFAEIPQNLILMTVGAFLIGWLLGSVGARFGGGVKTRKRDARDDRIRSLEAELRIAQSDAAKAREKVEAAEQKLEEAAETAKKRDKVIAHQQSHVEKLKSDLRDSVRKTRELRNELSERAEESVRSECRLREIETELSVVQASSDLIATGVLDYSLAPDNEDQPAVPDTDAGTASPGVPKTAG